MQIYYIQQTAHKIDRVRERERKEECTYYLFNDEYY